MSRAGNGFGTIMEEVEVFGAAKAVAEETGQQCDKAGDRFLPAPIWTATTPVSASRRRAR